MPRLVHRVGRLIACVLSGRALLLKPSDFSSLVDSLPLALEPLDSAAFKLAVLQSTAVGKARKCYGAWERQFAEKLETAIAQERFDPCYTFEGTEAQLYIDDYLEAFRASFTYINVASAATHDGNDVMYNVSLRAQRNVLDFLLQRYGRSIGEWNFVRSEVRCISGSSLNFVVTIGGLNYAFTPDGVQRLAREKDA